ncbi:MAG: hypothetical protein JRG94_21295 [Deltaproteobacteria bacterium]|nr:hypothetical protein [Deltaproteobacteria bacterium]
MRRYSILAGALWLCLYAVGCLSQAGWDQVAACSVQNDWADRQRCQEAQKTNQAEIEQRREDKQRRADDDERRTIERLRQQSEADQRRREYEALTPEEREKLAAKAERARLAMAKATAEEDRQWALKLSKSEALVALGFQGGALVALGFQGGSIDQPADLAWLNGTWRRVSSRRWKKNDEYSLTLYIVTGPDTLATIRQDIRPKSKSLNREATFKSVFVYNFTRKLEYTFKRDGDSIVLYSKWSNEEDSRLTKISDGRMRTSDSKYSSAVYEFEKFYPTFKIKE